MLDRIPTKPNRYAVYDDAHNFVRYEYHERADEPTQAGDALNKANLLPDAVATALGLTGNPQVKDALEKIKTLVDSNTALANSKAKIATGSYTGTGTFGAANKITLPAPFDVKLLILVAGDTARGEMMYSVPRGLLGVAFVRLNDVTTFDWSQLRSVSFHGISASSNFNQSGIAYYYALIG